jgi:ribosome-binding protein aMBF1 (putative translation factor)
MPDSIRKTRNGKGDTDVLIDHAAAQRIREMREARGYSPEALSAAIKQAGKDAPWGDRGAVDAHTIRRIERHGHVPGPRIQFVLSQFLGFAAPHELWLPRSSRPAERQAA